MLNRARIEAEYKIVPLKSENPAVLQLKIVSIYLECLKNTYFIYFLDFGRNTDVMLTFGWKEI